MSEKNCSEQHRIGIIFLADRTACSMTGYWHHHVVCLSVCQSVTLCVVAKRYNLQQKCPNKWIGSALQRIRQYNFQLSMPTVPWTPHPKIFNAVRSAISAIAALLV